VNFYSQRTSRPAPRLLPSCTVRYGVVIPYRKAYQLPPSTAYRSLHSRPTREDGSASFGFARPTHRDALKSYPVRWYRRYPPTLVNTAVSFCTSSSRRVVCLWHSPSRTHLPHFGGAALRLLMSSSHLLHGSYPLLMSLLRCE
jgi:hypothetical protein